MKRVIALAVCFLVCALWLVPAASADNPISFDAYRAAVAQALDLVTQATGQSFDTRGPLLDRAAALLEPLDAVTLPSGAETAVDNRELLTLIRDPNKTQVAQTRLAALRDALAQPLNPISASDLVLLQTLLHRPPFAQESSALPGWLDDILVRIQQFFDRLVNNTARGVFDGRDLIVLLGIVLVIVVLLYLMRGLRRNLVKEETLADFPQAREVRTPGEAFDNARTFAKQGDYRNAVRQLYLATLLQLDRQGKIKFDPTLTNREYLRQTSNDPGTAAALAPIVETFDRVWYGFEPITPTEFDAYRTRVEMVQEL